MGINLNSGILFKLLIIKNSILYKNWFYLCDIKFIDRNNIKV